MKLSIVAMFVLLFGDLLGIAHATQTSTNITVRVSVNSAPCKINNGQIIDVDFGSNIVTTDVAKGTVEKTINYTLDCANADTQKLLKMRITGTGASFNSDVLKTSINELGVKIKADGTDYPVNTNLNLATINSKPQLTALLVQQAGVRLPTGQFTAGATMTVDYQ